MDTEARSLYLRNGSYFGESDLYRSGHSVKYRPSLD